MKVTKLSERGRAILATIEHLRQRSIDMQEQLTEMQEIMLAQEEVINLNTKRVNSVAEFLLSRLDDNK